MKKVLFLLFLSACASETNIKSEINEANYCDTKEDCVDIGSKCPFGCYIYVNKAEADRIRWTVV